MFVTLKPIVLVIVLNCFKDYTVNFQTKDKSRQTKIKTYIQAFLELYIIPNIFNFFAMLLYAINMFRYTVMLPKTSELSLYIFSLLNQG